MSLDRSSDPRSIKHFMSQSPRTIDAAATVEQAWLEMENHNIRHLPVVSGDELVGLVSSRDLTGDPEAQVAEVMSPRPYTANPNDSIAVVGAHMAAFKIGSAVIVEDGVIVGIFTSQDAARALFLLARDERT